MLTDHCNLNCTKNDVFAAALVTQLNSGHAGPSQTQGPKGTALVALARAQSECIMCSARLAVVCDRSQAVKYSQSFRCCIIPLSPYRQSLLPFWELQMMQLLLMAPLAVATRARPHDCLGDCAFLISRNHTSYAWLSNITSRVNL